MYVESRVKATWGTYCELSRSRWTRTDDAITCRSSTRTVYTVCTSLDNTRHLDADMAFTAGNSGQGERVVCFSFPEEDAGRTNLHYGPWITGSQTLVDELPAPRSRPCVALEWGCGRSRWPVFYELPMSGHLARIWSLLVAAVGPPAAWTSWREMDASRHLVGAAAAVRRA